MAKKDKYTGPTPEEMDRAARMIEANIPPGSSSRLRDTNPMPSKEEADKQTMEMEKALLKGASMGGMGEALQDTISKKKGGKITAANYDKEYGKIYRKAVKNMSSGGKTASSRADGCCIRGKTRA
jgi:hypothetical protein